MKRRSRILAALTAGVMAAGAMCFGFAQWSTDISLGGSVSASGAWDVSVTEDFRGGHGTYLQAGCRVM